MTVAILLPLALAALMLARPWRSAALAAAPWAALPALALALVGSQDEIIEVPWLLLGARFGLDATARLFLFLTASLWLCAGLYAHRYLAADRGRARFTGFFLLACAGNLGLVLAQDVASFYLFFALMSFAAYGLVVHDGSQVARRAGRIYLVMVVIGEALLVAGFVLLVSVTGSLDLARAAAPSPSGAAVASAALLFAGFGIKAGAVTLHMWLPLAHPVAPTPASAVLSGAMVKAGLLGWLRFLPLGAEAHPVAGAVVIAAGGAAAFYAVAIGLTQRDPKVILAYSTISQMGIMTVGVGAGLLAPAAWPALLPALAIYALHHGFAKSSLFFGVGLARHAARNRRVVLAAQWLAALALAGAPLSSGALAKMQLKDALAGLPPPWPDALAWLLAMAAAATALLMIRFLSVAGGKLPAPSGRGAPPWAAWILLWSLWFFGAVVVGTAAGGMAIGRQLALGMAPAGIWAASWPLVTGALAAVILSLPLSGRLRRRLAAVPPGDLLAPLERGLSLCARAWRALPALPAVRLASAQPSRSLRAASRIESGLRLWTVAGTILLGLLGLLVFLFGPPG